MTIGFSNNILHPGVIYKVQLVLYDSWNIITAVLTSDFAFLFLLPFPPLCLNRHVHLPTPVYQPR